MAESKGCSDTAGEASGAAGAGTQSLFFPIRRHVCDIVLFEGASEGLDVRSAE